MENLRHKVAPLLLQSCQQRKMWFPRLLESPGFFLVTVPGSRKSWKMS